MRVVIVKMVRRLVVSFSTDYGGSKRFVASRVSTYEEHAFRCIVSSYETAHHLLPRTNRQQ